MTDIAGSTTYTIELIGVGVEEALRIEPNPVDFGAVLAGEAKTVEFTITNLLDRPVDLFGDAQGGSPNVVTTGSGTFRVDATIGTNGSLLPDGEQLAANQSVTLQATYRPSATNFGMQDGATWTISNCSFQLCETTVRFLGQGTDVALFCEPASVDFGAVNSGLDAKPHRHV